MTDFCIVETNDGMTIAEIYEGASAEDAAEREGGTLIEAGPFANYDDAYDALLNLEPLGEADQDESGDLRIGLP